MNRQVLDTVVPRKKIGLWTPWGLQRVADFENVRRPMRWGEKKERDAECGKRAEPTPGLR